mgnify:CR=1 FL=1
MTRVRAINGFRIKEQNDGGIIIQYLVDGAFFTQSKYRDVDKEKIERIKERLEDYTSTNREAKELCRTIPLMTIINFIENIILDNK